MKKNLIFIVLAAALGLLLGYVIFGNTNHNEDSIADHHLLKEVEQKLWTCSMHPQIMLPKSGDCPICGMDLIPASDIENTLSANQFAMTENAIALANIQTTTVGNKDNTSENEITLSGEIVENEETSAVQASYFDGRLERLYINHQGQEVRKGQVLATIYAPALIAAQQELITAASLKVSQPKLYQAVRNKLKNWKLSEKQINSIENSGNVINSFPIYATVSGTVSELMIAEGAYVQEGQSIASITNLNTVWAKFDIYEAQLAQFNIGQKIHITTHAYPDQQLDAVLSFIDPIVNKNTRTISIRATITNTNNLFKPGMFITGKTLSSQKENKDQFSIPSSAIMWTGKRSLVYIKTDPNTPIFEMREVVLGQQNGEQTTIISGLKLGEELVTQGTFTVDAAAQLQGKKSMMNKTINSKSDTSTTSEFTTIFKKDFEQTLISYFKIKDAFIDDNTASIKQETTLLLDQLNNVNLSEISEKERKYISTNIATLKAILKKDNIEYQREHFIILSNHVLEITSKIDALQNTIYVQQCPMADKNQGALWLSTEKEIRNPYFGHKMLKCGSVIKTLN